MKKLFCLLIAALMLFSLSACVSNTASSNGLPDGYDIDKIRTTCQDIISDLNNESYDEINNLFSENLKAKLTEDKLKNMCSEKITAAGKVGTLNSIAYSHKTSSSGDEEYAVVQFTDRFEKSDIVFTVTFQKDLKIIGFELKEVKKK